MHYLDIKDHQRIGLHHRGINNSLYTRGRRPRWFLKPGMEFHQDGLRTQDIQASMQIPIYHLNPNISLHLWWDRVGRLDSTVSTLPQAKTRHHLDIKDS